MTTIILGILIIILIGCHQEHEGILKGDSTPGLKGSIVTGKDVYGR